MSLYVRFEFLQVAVRGFEFPSVVTRFCPEEIQDGQGQEEGGFDRLHRRQPTLQAAQRSPGRQTKSLRVHPWRFWQARWALVRKVVAKLNLNYWTFRIMWLLANPVKCSSSTERAPPLNSELLTGIGKMWSVKGLVPIWWKTQERVFTSL